MKLDNAAGGASTVSGAASVLGSWQICHNLCLAVIAGLSVLGITVTGMPLLFLAQYAVWIWGVAAVMLATTILLYVVKRCISRGLLLLNAGLVLAGTPFFAATQPVFWMAGGAVAATGAGLIVYDRKNKECCS